jgi:putative pyruvate formate lyase activating enzyme
VHFPALRQLLQALKSSQFPLPIVLKSSGYENVEEIQKLSGLVDIYLPDLKFGNISSWAVRAGVRNYFNKAQEAIAEMIRQVGEPHYENGILKRGVLVRHVEAPLPEAEKREIHAYLEALPAEISLVPHFVNLE